MHVERRKAVEAVGAESTISTLHYPILLHTTLHYFTVLYSTLHCTTLLYCTASETRAAEVTYGASDKANRFTVRMQCTLASTD